MPSNSFFRFLEELRKKPDHTKKKILFATVLVLMICIIALWLSLPDFTNTEKNALEQQAGPFRVLWKEIIENIPQLNKNE